MWNQYGCHVTNVLADGTVPAAAPPSWSLDSAAGNSFRVNQQLPPPLPYLPNLTAALLKRGYAADDVLKILGGNWLRVLRQVIG